MNIENYGRIDAENTKICYLLKDIVLFKKQVDDEKIYC